MVSEIPSPKPGSKWRDYYVWSDTQEKSRKRASSSRISAVQLDLGPGRPGLFLAPVYAHQPDLNFEPEVHQEIIKVFDFWLDLGVDGMRLDAVTYSLRNAKAPIVRICRRPTIPEKAASHMMPNMATGCCWRRANHWPEDAVA